LEFRPDPIWDPAEVVAMLQDSMTDFATKMNLNVARLLLEDEVNQRCGCRYERVPERTVTRYGHQPGMLTTLPHAKTIDRQEGWGAFRIGRETRWGQSRFRCAKIGIVPFPRASKSKG